MRGITARNQLKVKLNINHLTIDDGIGLTEKERYMYVKGELNRINTKISKNKKKDDYASRVIELEDYLKKKDEEIQDLKTKGVKKEKETDPDYSLLDDYKKVVHKDLLENRSDDKNRRLYKLFRKCKKASVVGDTVGDPLKDTSGPSLNILVKLSSIISVVFGTLFSKTAFLLKI